MPTRTRSIPQLRHHRATGQAAVVPGGKWHYLGVHGTPPAEERYKRLIANWFTNGRRVSETPEMCIRGLILMYWRDAAVRDVDANDQPTEDLTAIRTALRPVKGLLGSTCVEGLRPRALAAVQRELVQAGYPRSTVNDHVRRVRRTFPWATARELSPPRVHHGLQGCGEADVPLLAALTSDKLYLGRVSDGGVLLYPVIQPDTRSPKEVKAAGHRPRNSICSTAIAGLRGEEGKGPNPSAQRFTLGC